MADHGNPIAYPVLEKGTPVLASDGTEVGRVKRVLADSGTDIFDGITIDTSDGERFVDAPEVDSLYERAVILTLDAAAAAALPEHSPAPAVDQLTADTLGGGPRNGLRRVWDRMTGRY
jgi:hypothetical protein